MPLDHLENEAVNAESPVSRRTVLSLISAGGMTAAVLGIIERPLATRAEPLKILMAEEAQHVVIHSYKIVPGTSLEDMTELHRSEYLPFINLIPGFVEYVAYAAGNGEFRTISLFATAEGAAVARLAASALVEGDDSSLEIIDDANILLHAVAEVSEPEPTPTPRPFR
jgi:hypothetical protein